MSAAGRLDETAPGRLETALRARRDAGHKLLVPYVTGGMDDQWLLTVEALAGAGADAIEVGIPFSDPMIDGAIIQEASLRALRRGTTPDGILADLSRIEVGVPLVVMTYFNVIERAGHERMAGTMADLRRVGGHRPRSAPRGDSTAGPAPPTGPAWPPCCWQPPRPPTSASTAICRRSRGFVYAVGRMGVTGEQAELADTSRQVAGRLVAATDLPVCVGIGVSTPEQAAVVCQVADGVVVGSALVRRLLEGEGPGGGGVLRGLAAPRPRRSHLIAAGSGRVRDGRAGRRPAGTTGGRAARCDPRAGGG